MSSTGEAVRNKYVPLVLLNHLLVYVHLPCFAHDICKLGLASFAV